MSGESSVSSVRALAPELLAELREVLLAAASLRDAGFASDSVKRRIEVLRGRDWVTETEFGNVLDVVEGGPDGSSERELARGIALAALDTAEAPHFAADIVWLAANTPFSVLEHLDDATHFSHDAFWDAVAAYAERALRHEASAWRRGELFVALAALARSDNTRARAHRESLRSQADALALPVLGEGASGVEVMCRLGPTPRAPWLTFLLGITGLSLILQIARFFGRTLFGMERRAQFRVTPQSLEVRADGQMRGAPSHDQRLLFPKSGLASITRETRFGRLPGLVGALALLAGTAVGTGALAEALRQGAPSLVLIALSLLALGFGVDYALCELWPKRPGRVRLVVVPRAGRAVALEDLDEAAADRALRLLERPA